MKDSKQLAKQLTEIIPVMARVLSSEIRAFGYMPSPAQFTVMVALAYHTCNLSKLAEEQGVSLPSMSSTVDTLEDRGWVRRSRSTIDRRVVNIELTKSGLNHLLEMQRHAENQIMKLLEPIGEDDYAKLCEGLEVMSRVFVISERPADSEESTD